MENACAHDDHQRLVDAGFSDDGGLTVRHVNIRRHIAVAFRLGARRLRAGWHLEPDAQSVQANHISLGVGMDGR